MTSKERLERIENFIWGSPITKEYRESLNADVKEIVKDLEQKEKQDAFLSLLIEKGVDINAIKATKNYMEYNSFVAYVCPDLSEEEYIEIKEGISKWQQ